MFKKAITVIAASVGMAGCATNQVDPATQAKANEPLLCDGKAQCDRYWQAAQVWVVGNSGYKVQTVTDSVIQTYGPMGHDTTLAFVVLREPQGGEKSRILVKAGCANMFGCHPPALKAIAEFKDYVRRTDTK